MGWKSGLAVAGALTLGLAACGDSDDETSTAGAAEMSEDEMSDDSTAEAAMDDDTSEDDMSEDDMMEEDEHDAMGDEPHTFTITIENLTADTDVPTPLAPGVAIVHGDGRVILEEGSQASAGLEALTEDGNPDGWASETGGTVFAVPTGGSDPAPAGPGDSYTFEVTATDSHALTFATMFVQSNDWFFAPGHEGIELFDGDGDPISGDISDQIYLWDAGTEADQTPGEGSDQAPRQAGPNTGDADPDDELRMLEPANGIRVTIEAN
jgi:hypothetical protein